MVRSDLVAKLLEENPELRPAELQEAVKAFFDIMSERLANGGRVELRDFGVLCTKQYDARAGRNPVTGDSVAVPAKRLVRFKQGKGLKQRLNTKALKRVAES